MSNRNFVLTLLINLLFFKVDVFKIFPRIVEDVYTILDHRYVLLKERNMLMTMEAYYDAESELFPNPERIDKVSHIDATFQVLGQRNKSFCF